MVVYFGELKGGTEQTVAYCIKRQKPYKLIDANEVDVKRAVELLAEFVARYNINVLNIAGPRQSKAPRAHEYTFCVVLQFLGGG